VDTRAPLIPHVEAAKLMEPGQRAFDDPACPTETTPVLGPPLRQLRLDASAVECIAVRLRIVAAVPLHEIRLAPRGAWPAAHGRHRVHQRQQLRDVVPVGGRQLRRKRNPLAVSENVMFRPRLTAIGWVRSSFFPPRSARMEELSAMARARSNWPRWRNSASSPACRRFQTPARCQRTRRRQQVLPDPHPISFGSICHGKPLRKTNRIPVKTARSGTRGRPIALNRRRGGFGNSGSIRRQNASSIRGWARRDRLAAGPETVPISPRQYKTHVSYF
jgi:hypothetical protein